MARGFAGDIPHLTGLYVQALQHRGFALVDVFQPCVTWNKLNTFQWFRERVYKLDEIRLGRVEQGGGVRALAHVISRADVHARGVPGADRRVLPRRRCTCVRRRGLSEHRARVEASREAEGPLGYHKQDDVGRPRSVAARVSALEPSARRGGVPPQLSSACGGAAQGATRNRRRTNASATAGSN